MPLPPKCPVPTWQVIRALFSVLDSKKVLTLTQTYPASVEAGIPLRQRVYTNSAIVETTAQGVVFYRQAKNQLLGRDDSVDWSVLLMSVALEPAQHGAQQGSGIRRVVQYGP